MHDITTNVIVQIMPLAYYSPKREVELIGNSEHYTFPQLFAPF